MLYYNQSVYIRLAHRLYTDFHYFSIENCDVDEEYRGGQYIIITFTIFSVSFVGRMCAFLLKLDNRFLIVTSVERTINNNFCENWVFSLKMY